MNRRMLPVLALVLGVVSCAWAEEKKAPASPAFEALKKLAGDWVEVGPDGKPTDKVVTSFRLTAGGSVVQETLFAGTDHEMVTMYHQDGADLVLTHYCAIGNQPRMRAESTKDAGRIVFKCAGGSNLKSESDTHMHHATLTLSGSDRYSAEWIAQQDGKECHKASFNLARKK